MNKNVSNDDIDKARTFLINEMNIPSNVVDIMTNQEILDIHIPEIESGALL